MQEKCKKIGTKNMIEVLIKQSNIWHQCLYK